MAQVVDILGRGGQYFAETVMGWNRGTIRKGQHEIRSGLTIEDRYSACGRRRAEYHLPNLLQDIRSIVEPSGQTDPTFRSTRIYTPLSGEEVRLRLRKVKKCTPLKKIPETDALCVNLSSDTPCLS